MFFHWWNPPPLKSIEEVPSPCHGVWRLRYYYWKGPSARTVQPELPPFTMVAATTASPSSLLRLPRFSGGTFRLEFYSDEEIAQILTRSAEPLEVSASMEAIHKIATRCRATPNVPPTIYWNVDLAQLEGGGLTDRIIEKTFDLLEIDSLGLGKPDRAVLEVIVQKFNGGPVGSTLSLPLLAKNHLL